MGDDPDVRGIFQGLENRPTDGPGSAVVRWSSRAGGACWPYGLVFDVPEDGGRWFSHVLTILAIPEICHNFSAGKVSQL